MKTSLLSFVAAVGLLATTNSFAATTIPDHERDGRRTEEYRNNDRHTSAGERARYEASQRKNQREQERRVAQERARYEAQRRADQQRAAERARYEAQRRHNDHGRDRDREYGYQR
ncbi:hypothetical protein [Hymenobacter sp. BT491]|uniref:hypothetical protein n=1 Tax=Hymenobacter sp. BT491 TaxID=2766779 RepID=UPI00165364D3|nr:hypothetical protein [Hymenobacter sp. BT491]MBC6990660.1 hypothetical protein [Hymenobacter sp. BT491]